MFRFEKLESDLVFYSFFLAHRQVDSPRRDGVFGCFNNGPCVSETAPLRCNEASPRPCALMTNRVTMQLWNHTTQKHMAGQVEYF